MKKLMFASSLSSTRLVEVRETKNKFIDLSEKATEFIKLRGRTSGVECSYTARTEDAFNAEYLFELDSDFAILNCSNILQLEHPNKEYIKNRYSDLKNIQKARQLLNKLSAEMTVESAIRIVKLLENF